MYIYTHADSSSRARNAHSPATSPDNAATRLSSTPSRYNMYHSIYIDTLMQKSPRF